MELPERYKSMDTEDDDEDDGTGAGGGLPQQSMYGMLAATQSKAYHPSRFQQDSGSESEGEHTRAESEVGLGKPKKSKSKSAGRDVGEDKAQHKQIGKLSKSVFTPATGSTDSQGQDQMTKSQILPSRQRAESPIERPSSVPAEKPVRGDTPLLGRKLEAMARAAKKDELSSAGGSRKSMEDGRGDEPTGTLPQAIAQIFKLKEVEDVISVSPCWYLQNVMLEGDMYITENHVCFYSYLQTKTSSAVKTGRLSKRGKHSYTYRPYHFELKGDTFAYYQSAAEPYTPLGLVDLRLAIEAKITSEKDGGDGTYFTIRTDNRNYEYRADTVAAAKDWVKALQNVIFRKTTSGNTVKISLLIEDIMDVEQADVMDFAQTLKLRVMSSDDTYAIDDYFFSFFDKESDTGRFLKSLGQRGTTDVNQLEVSPQKASMTQLSSHAKSAARDIPGSSRRVAGRSEDFSRDAAGLSRSPVSQSMDDSVESFYTSSEQQSDSANEEPMDANMSASQMLFGDGVFHRPTLRRPRTQPVEEGQEDSEASSRSSSRGPTQMPPPPRPTTAQVTGAQRDLRRQRSNASSTTATATENQVTQKSSRGSLVRGISTPIAAVAGMVRSSGQAVTSVLSSSPRSYVSNWSAAIAGGKRHYANVEGLAPDDSIRDPEQEVDAAQHEQSFQQHFGLPGAERLVSIFYCWLHRTVPIYGKIYMGSSRFCFRSLVYGTKTKIVLPYKDIINVQKSRGFRWGSQGMVLVIRGHEELFFDFSGDGMRDEATVIVLRALEKAQTIEQSSLLTQEEQDDAATAAAENRLLQNFRRDSYANQDLQIPGTADEDDPATRAIIFDGPDVDMLDLKPKKPLRITCLTIGSRGDVQPYVALCQGLKAEGHMPVIATHAEFKGFVEENGIEFAEIAGDPAVLMKLCVDNGMFSPKFFVEVNRNFRGWLQELLDTAWHACQGSDVLIESPSAMCGLHIAEALEIPYFRAFTMPWTRTRAYPHAFSVPSDNQKRGGSYNYMTYTFFDSIFWGMTSGQINRWRTQTLGIGPTSMDKMDQHKVPFLYNFSPNVVVPPLDFSSWVHVTGYWFLDTMTNFKPPDDLAAFIKDAKDKKRKIVYIGFGSVTVQDSKLLMQQVVNAVKDAGVYCVLAKGWSDRMDKDKDRTEEVELPSSILQIKACPHDWLFAQMDAVVHHGGAGTTGASLRAGVPTLIRPFFGDQFFFASRVEDLGVGMWLQKLTAKALSKALFIATHDERMRKKAAALGEAIRSEDGVQTAIKALWREMDHARGLIKRSGKKDMDEANPELSVTEENWTFLDSTGMEIQDEDPVAVTPTEATSKLEKGKGKQPASNPSSASLTKMAMHGRG